MVPIKRSPTPVILDRRLIQRVLVTAFALLNLAYGATLYAKFAMGRGELWGITKLFNMDNENNIPTWFEAQLFFIAGMLLFLIYRCQRTVLSVWTRHWLGLSIIFFILSMDEISSMHERLNKPLTILLHIDGGMFYYPWVLVAAALLIVFAVLYWNFFWNLPAGFRYRSLIASGVFIGGAVVAEIFGGDRASVLGTGHLRYIFTAWAEEACEAAGVLYFVTILLQRLEMEKSEFFLEFK